MTALPRGWAHTSLGAVIELKYGKSLPKDDRKEGPYNVYGSNGIVGTNQSSLSSAPAIIVGRKGSFGEVAYSAEKCFPIDTTYYVDEFYVVEPHFCYSLLKHLPLKSLNRATAIPGLNREDAYGLTFALPPLAEQKRIVAKLDALNAKSARASTKLARIESLVSGYKQAVLDLLCDVSHSTASLRELVDQKRGIPYGIVQTGKPVVDGVPTVRCGDIKNYSIKKNELKLVDRQIARQYGRTKLVGGEVLIAIRGSIGETCVADNDLVGCNISREVAMIPLLPGTSPQFIMYFLKSNKAKEFIGANTKGSAQQGINLGDLRNLPIPALGLEEQHEIVCRIESAFAKIDRLAKEAKRALALVGRLNEAILAKAFRGELVPQDENDEPAEKLLERIRAERRRRRK